MKISNFIFAIACLLNSASLLAFAPQGSIWHFTIDAGFKKGYATMQPGSDTIVMGKKCRILKVEYFLSQTGKPVDPPIIFYEDSNRVFVYREGTKHFTTWYDYSKKGGETWSFEDFYGNNQTVTVLNFDSIVIGSKKFSRQIVKIGAFKNPDTILNNIGNINHPYPIPFVWNVELSAGEIRCYSDSVINYRHGIYNCLDIVVGINNENPANFRLYPNPVYTNIFIEPLLPLSITGIEIFDYYGRRLLFITSGLTNSKVTIDCSSLKPGVYILKINEHTDYNYYTFIKS